MKYMIPLAFFVIIGIIFFIKLDDVGDTREKIKENKEVTSAQIIILEEKATEQEKAFFQQNITGKRYLLNFFASWCQPCQVEHPLLMKLAKEYQTTIVGVAWHDISMNTQKYLASSGNPYSSVISDPKGANGINYGIKGIPETFLIDERGNVLHHVSGPITEEIMKKHLLPKLGNW